MPNVTMDSYIQWKLVIPNSEKPGEIYTINRFHVLFVLVGVVRQACYIPYPKPFIKARVAVHHLPIHESHVGTEMHRLSLV